MSLLQQLVLAAWFLPFYVTDVTRKSVWCREKFSPSLPVHNPYRQTRHERSANRLSQLPADSGREAAFCGRSNTGKSSVINVLTAQHRLARASRQPGRTQQLNFFTVAAGVRLVDLPGYGYARVPRALQAHWHNTVNRYLQSRQSLSGLILIVDIRRSLNDQDQQLLGWCQAVALPVHVLLNKSDKLSRSAAQSRLLALQHEFAAADGISMQLFSVLKKTGVEELQGRLNGWLFAHVM